MEEDKSMTATAQNIPSNTYNDCPEVHTQVRGNVGFITLNRPQALNALSLPMIRSLLTTIRQWQADSTIVAVAMRGNSKTGAFGNFCAGGDIRFLYHQSLENSPQIDDFFTEQYAVDYILHHLGKPYIAFMDGLVMGGGMGLAQGASHRIVTERSQLAMPETRIGFFPDVGGGYFLSRCPGYVGQWLALTGQSVYGADALAIGWADYYLPSAQQADIWQQLGNLSCTSSEAITQWLLDNLPKAIETSPTMRHSIQQAHNFFASDNVPDIMQQLTQAASSTWAQQALRSLQYNSPLMLHVVLEQVRSARHLSLRDNILRERSMAHHCFAPQHLQRDIATSEVIEGIRALIIDKDHTPNWQPKHIKSVSHKMVAGFFADVWAPDAHPMLPLLPTEQD